MADYGRELPNPFRVSWRGPNAEGRMIFRYVDYPDRRRAQVAVADLIGKPLNKQVQYIDLRTEQCADCGGIEPNCDCTGEEM